MTAELTQDVIDRLTTDHYCWLTTVAKSGRPVPKLVWFLLDDTDLIVYSEPSAAKVRHVDAHADVSVNLDSDGNGGGIIVVGGTAVIDETGVDPRADRAYWAKYQASADQFGLSDAMGNYSTRIRISIDKVWTTPTVPE